MILSTDSVARGNTSAIVFLFFHPLILGQKNLEHPNLKIATVAAQEHITRPQ